MVTLHLPELSWQIPRVLESPIRRLRWPAGEASGTLTPYSSRSVTGETFTPDANESFGQPVLVVGKSTGAAGLPPNVLLSPGGLPTSSFAPGLRWLAPKLEPFPADLDACEQLCGSITAAWQGAFQFKAERRVSGQVVERGLRPPQVGALHAVLAHWTVTHEPATVVMPTGTGKTETMLGLLVAERLCRVLVLVPTDALRDQIAAKFLSLGVLKAAGVVSGAAPLPVVGVLRRKPKTVGEVDEFFRRCNVVVTTAQIAGQCVEPVSKRIAELSTHLIVDEAHHVPAVTWRRVRTSFAGKPVLQFTATPYRGDGKLVDGRVIYNYPLRKAQAEGYFRTIRFLPVEEFIEERADERIAVAALKQLGADRAAGHDHLLMARCATIKRAAAVLDIYQRLAAEFNPVLAHSELPGTEKRQAVSALRTRTSRVVVCVDMFGEGFDLPELKIAAMHDIHKSLAVTLQFTGRFTRTQANVGDATIVANTANPEVDEALQSLYGEDPDWNLLLRDLTEEASGVHTGRSTFLEGFTELPERVSLQNIYPKMSTVVFETQCAAWHPERVESVLKTIYDKPALNPKHQVLVLVTKETQPVEWGDIRAISNVVYDLYILHWDKAAGLLYIHSSDKGTVHEDLAQAVCGADAKLIRGEQVFRSLSGVNRLILSNLGLGHSLSRAVRFTMHVGADIRQGWTEAQAQNKYKTNVFGRGFTGGEKVTVGCSIKGRLWSFHAAEDVAEWVGWCHEIGSKLQDRSVAVTDVLKGVMIPDSVTDRPAKVPLAIEWSEHLLNRSEDGVTLELAGVQAPFYEVGLEVSDFSESGPIRFRVTSGRWPSPAEFEIRFSKDRVDCVPTAVGDPAVLIGKRRWALSKYLQEEPPVIRFHDGSFLIYNDLFEAPAGGRRAYDPAQIVPWVWTGVDLTKESQTQAKLPDSIQRRVIETVLAETAGGPFDVVFDDDAAGEAADVVALRLEVDRLLVRLYHCKFSKEPTAGKRVKDLYEVCGQAQRCIYWKGQPDALLDHLQSREASRLRKGGVSRFERGDSRQLNVIRKKLRMLETVFEVYVVQPGLAVSQVEESQLELLAVTELYLLETWGAKFIVIASN
ncbi:DEAD/DEAH box helicase [Gemmata sp.]|uniref:DEAD/DEAH box helicase n=1 Tax=Gemmata sp. TaxID=1914242 RepID=UPI003F6EA276